MLEGLHAFNLDSLERASGSQSFTMTRLEHCRILLPDEILLYESLSFDEEGYRDSTFCSWRYIDTAGSEDRSKFLVWDRGARFFKHNCRYPFLNEITAYSTLDSEFYMADVLDTITQEFQQELHRSYLPEMLVVKVFNRDKEFEAAFPAWENSATFLYDDLIGMYRQAFVEVDALADSMGMRMARRKLFTDPEYYPEFAPLQFKADLEICTWINYETYARMQLALMPARPWDEYAISISEGPKGWTLYYDRNTERYDTIPWPSSGAFPENEHGWNITRRDLAIWLVYIGPHNDTRE